MKRIIVCLFVIGVLFAALPVSDAFVGPDGTPLTTYNANWVNGISLFRIQGNAARPQGSSAYSVTGWTGDTFANDQYAEIVVKAFGGSGTYIGPAVRLNTANGDGYLLLSDGSSTVVQKMVSGSPTTLTSTSNSVVATDVLRLEVSGTTLTAKLNGSTIAALTTTDATYSSGVAGIGGYNDLASDIESWTAGNLSGGTAVRRKAVIFQ